MQAQTLVVNLPLHGVTMGPTYNEFGCSKHPAAPSKCLRIKTLIDRNAKGRKEHLLATNIFFRIILLIVSRMRTARALTVSPSMLCAGVSALEGGACSWGGVCSLGGGIPTCTEADPPVNRITHACENRTLPQLRCGR